jgi:hypothetical protein
MTITLTCERCIIDELAEKIVFQGIRVGLEVSLPIKRWIRGLKRIFSLSLAVPA